MRKLWALFAITAAILSVSSLDWKADAQTSRGAMTIPAQAQNFTPIEKAACGPHRGRWCGPGYHRVCSYSSYYRRHLCRCVPC